MRKIIMSLLAVATIFLSAFFATSTASAYPIPPDANGIKFWSSSICVGSTLDPDLYRVAYIAQLWNQRTTTLELDYSTDCAADGYPPSRRMAISTFSNASLNDCITIQNTQVSVVNGYQRWTNGPVSYINRGLTGCVGTQSQRDHIVSAAMGELLGLKPLNSTGYNSRVMNFTSYSWLNVPLPDQSSANTLDMIYSWGYCQPFGTAC